jgi:hypothetical protein
MATAYSSEAWMDLFVASAGASAALTGLLFVAVSVNIKQILEIDGLPARALQTLLMLLSVVVISLVGLIPGQGTTALGLELLLVGLCFGAGIWTLFVRSAAETRKHVRVELHLILIAPGTLPLLLGGASILARAGGGLYWIIGGIVGAMVGASINAWVLLVENLR